MSTHGVFCIKVGNSVYGFHKTSDGYDVMDFYKQNRYLKDAEMIFLMACEFFAESCYDDCPQLNFYRENYDPENDYSNITSYTAYFDGNKWSHNFRGDCNG